MKKAKKETKPAKMGSKIPSDRIYHSDKVLAGIPQLLDDFSQLIDDQETGMSTKIAHFCGRAARTMEKEHKLFSMLSKEAKETH